MKTLYAKQQEAHDFFLQHQLAGKATLDTSDVGTGKTIVGCTLAQSLNRPVAVMCPKAVIPVWQREFAEMGIEPLFVLNYEKLKTGGTKWVDKIGKNIYKWQLPEDTLVLIDESHKCAGAYTQNAQLMISLKQQNYALHMMSATAAEDPTEMRALGYVLELHSLNKPANGLRSWYSWMMSNGCHRDDWGKWQLTRRDALVRLRVELYEHNGAKRLTVADFPDSFKLNRIFIEPIQFTHAAKIKAAYKDAGLTPEIVERYIETGTVEDDKHMIVNMLRARQLAEALKVPDLVDMARDLMQAGQSVVLFVNFTDTLELLCGALACKRINGKQSIAERQDAIDTFQADEEHCIVVNSAAGGTGISLHDINGNRPRVSLISPTFNAKEFAQLLGRIHRNGAKSDALQKILVANDSIETIVMKSVQERITNLKTLHQ